MSNTTGDNAKQATPRAKLIADLLNSNLAKTETEWAAADEIQRLQAELAERDKQYAVVLGKAEKLQEANQWLNDETVKDSMRIADLESAKASAVSVPVSIYAKLCNSKLDLDSDDLSIFLSVGGDK